MPAAATSEPRTPPASASIVLSARNVAAIRPRLPPSAARKATSRVRDSARTNSRLTTFAPAIISTKPTLPNRIQSGVAMSRITVSRSGSSVTDQRKPSRVSCVRSGNRSGMRRCSAAISCRAVSTRHQAQAAPVYACRRSRSPAAGRARAARSIACPDRETRTAAASRRRSPSPGHQPESAARRSSGSAPKRERHRLSVRIPTSGALSRASASVKVRPIAGRTDNASKNSGVTATVRTRSG